MNDIDTFLDKLTTLTEKVEFEQTMAIIDDNYEFKPTKFTNGDTINEAGENNGSCKLFAFAKLHGLNEQQTLSCFGHYYREDVLAHPDADDHQNIRNFIRTGWDGIKFDNRVLTLIGNN
ncbi:MAG: HopJ type III effector protein [Gammaproteobacteria bacterium]|nr:HopJ type III effector protein [Gammaproteobacteria bacterium]